MTTTPAHKLATTLTPAGGGTVTIGAPTNTLTAVLAPFFKGDPGDMSEVEIQDIAAQQDTVLVYDYDALVGATLSI